MKPRAVARPANQRPRLSQQPRRASGSEGDDAIEWAESIGWNVEEGRGFYVLDDWQKWCIRGILSVDDEYRLCALVSVLLVPRQNGKNVVLEVVELYALFVLEIRYILHSAHLAETSADHADRLWEAIESDEDLAPRCRRVVANGKERIYRVDVDEETGERKRGVIRFRTRSKKTGRGGSPQMVVFDEALYLTDRHVAAMLPSLASHSAKKDKPILIYTSSAPIGESQVLHRIRTAIRKGEMPDAWFAEWSTEVPKGVDRIQAMLRIVDDRELLIAANPGMPERLDPGWVMTTERPSMSLDTYVTERFGVVFEADGLDGVLPSTNWRMCQDEMSKLEAGRVALSVGPHGAWSSFGFAGVRDDGALHVEVVRHEQGTNWVVLAAWAAQKLYPDPILVDPKTDTIGVIPALRKAGVELEEVSLTDVRKASSAFEQDVRNCRVRHLNQPELNAAAAGAEIRTVGEGWVFSAKASTVDITPLESVVLAAFAARGEGDEASSNGEFVSLVIGG